MTARMRDHACLLLVQLAAIAVVGCAISPSAGFPLDDAWIHQIVARTFAESGTLGFEPGLHGAAATSFFWAFILALNPAMFGIAPSLFTLLVNIPLCVACGQLVLALLRRDGHDRLTAWVGAAAFSIAGNWVWFAYSGMESTLSVFLALLAIWLWTRPDQGPGSQLGAGIACAFLFLTRPEAILLAAVLGAPHLRRIKESWRRLVLLAAPLIVAVLAYVISNWALTGQPAPSTLSGRRWMWLLAQDGISGFDAATRLLLVWCNRLGEFTLGTASPILFWPAVGIAAIGVYILVRQGHGATVFLIAWTTTHLCVYLVILPAEGHGGRYQPLIPPMFALALAIGLLSLARSVRQRIATAIGLAIPLVYCLYGWSNDHARAVEHINATEIEMGHRVAALPANAKVATFDLGGIGWIARRPLVELGGLVDPATVDVIASGRAAELLRREAVDYVVVPVGYGTLFPDPWNYGMILLLFENPSIALTLVAETASPLEVWRPGLRATLHCAPRQLLFRVEYK